MNDIEQMSGAVLDSGLWHLDEAGETVFGPADYGGTTPDSHKFSFTPEALDLPHLVEQMQEIAAAVPGYIATIPEWFTSLPIDTGVSRQYKGIDLDNIFAPPITMLDAMATNDGKVRIAEIDVVNPRGLGYLAMYHNLYGYEAGAAAVDTVAQATTAPLTLFYGAMQGFYGQYFKILEASLQAHGVEVELATEHDLHIEGSEGVFLDGEEWDPQLLLDFPVLKKLTRKSYGPTAALLTEGFNSGEIDFLYPPQPQISSKLLLANASATGMFGDFLPPTHLVSDPATASSALASGQYCVKAAISSGMKGLIMPHDPSLQNLKMPAVAQELVADQHIFELEHASGGDSSWTQGKFLARLSMFVDTAGNLVAADLTGQPYIGEITGIHGNPNCVLAPIKVS